MTKYTSSKNVSITVFFNLFSITQCPSYIYIYIEREREREKERERERDQNSNFKHIMHKYCCIYTLRGTSRTQLNIYDEGSPLLFSQKSSFVEFRLDFKYASDISLYISM